MIDWGDAPHNASWCERVYELCAAEGVTPDIDDLVDRYTECQAPESAARDIVEEQLGG